MEEEILISSSINLTHWENTLTGMTFQMDEGYWLDSKKDGGVVLMRI